MTIQDELVQHIADHTELHGYPPSRRNLAEIMGLGLATTQRYLKEAKEEGLLTWEPGQPRTLRILK